MSAKSRNGMEIGGPAAAENPVAATSGVSAIDRLVLLVVSGYPAERAARSVGIAELAIPDAVAEVRRRLTLAAATNRDEQLGMAISRLNDLYAKAVKDADLKVAVTAQKELNRLHNLYRDQRTEAAGPDPELLAVREHLVPLAGMLDAEAAPLAELARLAVAEIVRLRHGR